jgi:putative phosphoribosyl transferase
VPAEPQGLVLFAHGSGSSRLSPRNRSVAGVLEDARLATVLFDLLSEEEALERANVFDIGLLASRMADAVAWARGQPALTDLPLGFFGASTGAAAALVAASRLGEAVSAVVSRGGRPDLAGARTLRDVSAPTLLIVGGRDDTVLELNRHALAELGGESRLEVVAGATHLFEEAGALERVAELATGWFVTHLAHERRQ